MSTLESIEDLEDTETGEKVSGLATRIERAVALEPVPSFVLGFFGSNSETFCKFINYLRKRLNISKKNQISIELSYGKTDFVYYFKENRDRLNEYERDILIISADKFERLPHFDSDDLRNISRSGWDYNQNLVNYTEDLRLSKKFVVVTHVGYSLGQERYERAMRGALLGSRHRTFVFELKNNKNAT